ncbi:MAG: LLM class flavin-dependent oxidoreductase, partial [Mesorhizobium sp.]
MIKAHPMHGQNKLKLGVFSTNADGGLAITDVPERWTASWQDNLTAAQIADRAGLEFILPIARWRGFGGRNKVREWSFETFTWAAALAVATEQIGLFMTVHVPLVHPLYAAKALATVDHISQGRAGLNIVCGWNPKEFGMFGTPLVEKGYDQAAEWIEILEKLYASDQPLDYDGTYYRLKEAVSRP